MIFVVSCKIWGFWFFFKVFVINNLVVFRVIKMYRLEFWGCNWVVIYFMLFCEIVVINLFCCGIYEGVG